MRIVGVTGSSGSGKSSVCKLIEEKYDAEIIDADKIARDLSQKGTMYYESIVEAFGSKIVSNGNLDRKKLADIIYEDEEKRRLLNECTFGYIVREIKKQINKLNHKSIILIDAPLLFESELDTICDFVIAVVSTRENQIKRICERDNLDEEVAIKRLDTQKSNTFFEEAADYIIYNNGDLEEVEKIIERNGLEEELLEK